MVDQQDSTRTGILERSRVYIKLAFLIILVLVSAIPLAMIRGLVLERQALRDSVAHEIAGSWGGVQRVVGPVLIVPITERRKEQVVNPHKKEPRDPAFIEKEVSERKHLFVLPEQLSIDGEVTPTSRSRGIYEALLYTARSRFLGRFAEPDIAVLGIENPIEVHWDRAQVEILISDLTGSLNAIALEWNGTTLPFAVSGTGDKIFAALPDLGQSDPWPAAFSFRVDLNGSRLLGFLPLGRTTEVGLRSSWPHPGFTGGFLPKVSDIGAEGFTARWRFRTSPDVCRNSGSPRTAAPGTCWRPLKCAA